MARGWTPTILNRWSVRGDQHGNRRSITKKGARRTQYSPSGGPEGSKYLPWDKNSLPVPVPLRQALLRFHRGRAIERAVTPSLCPGDGTNGFARLRSVLSSCAAGRQPNASSVGGAGRKFAGNTRRPNGTVVDGDAKKLALDKLSNPARLPIHCHHPRAVASGARGHAAKTILVIFATEQAVTSRCVFLAVHRLITAATRAVKLSTEFAIGNASTGGARKKRLIVGHRRKAILQEEAENRPPATRHRIEIQIRISAVRRVSAVIGALLK